MTRSKADPQPFRFTDRRKASISQPVDLRIRRTRHRLSEALVSLLKEKPYDQISVGDLAERAGIKRATYYLHFTEKNDLLGYVLREAADEMIGILNETAPERAGNLTREWSNRRYSQLLRHVQKHAVLYRAILCAKDGTRYAADISEFLERTWTIESVRRHAATEVAADKNKVAIIARFGAAGLNGLLKWWLETNMRLPVPKLAEEITELMFEGPLHAMGIKRAER